MSVLLESKVCVITHGYAREEAKVFLAGRTPSERDQVSDEWLCPVLSNAKVAGRESHGYTAMEGTNARSCV